MYDTRKTVKLEPWMLEELLELVADRIEDIEDGTRIYGDAVDQKTKVADFDEIKRFLKAAE